MSKMPTRTQESLVKTKVKKVLDDHGYFWWMTPANGFGTSGISDICAIKTGMLLAIETKAGANKPTAMQKAFLRSVAGCDHFALVVSDKTLEHLKMFLSALDESIALAAEERAVPSEIGGTMLDMLTVLTKPWMEE